MKKTKIGHFLSILLLLLLSCASSKTTTPTEDQSVYRRLSDKYVQGFNTGKPDSLAPIVSQIFTSQFLENNGGNLAYATDRMELYRTYGPLAYSFTDTVSTPPIVWYKGKISQGWVGFQFYLTNSLANKSNRLSTWRARPVDFPPAPQTEQEIVDSLEQYLNRLAAANLFDGTVTLSHKGKILLNKVWGSDKKETPNPITTTTLFHTASVTKLFTAILALQLIEEGKLSLNDTIGNFLPDYPEPYKSKVAIIHLLTHTSGIKLNDDINYIKDINAAENVDDLIAAQIQSLKNKDAKVAPGSEYNYSSEGFDVLGAITERVTKKSWKTLVEERIFSPVGMNDSRVNIPKKEGNYAVGKTSLKACFEISEENKLSNSMEVLPQYAKPSGGIWSNASDLHKFMQAILNQKLLSKEMTERLLSQDRITAEFPKYGIVSWVGLGAQGEDLWGIRTVGHGGVVPGYSAAIEYLPANEWLLTVTSNTGEATGYLVFQRFLELTANYKNN
ncbi:serine hydrolase domain-containing protein [Pontibacter cellulosilyticus]|uniref:Beta-lactamase family protein n=1 Tax=Pontibacter cellulosilyticus TaxID=1720253 RepID=A0A923N5J7_9BACT|nr:serine hydrolase domain-containing protein [Pontibacter cellulosilyticus]MBC5991307.1 beta-lactamase family protein [Pontibacter cellulosilyticus]